MSSSELDIAATRAFGGFTLDIAQKIPLAGCTAVFGPSGAGKSTLLRLIAGVLRPDSGRIAFGDDVWCDTNVGAFLPAHRRPVGTVFQDGRLFPHLTVEKNLFYADRRGGSGDAHKSIDNVIDAFDLEPLLLRRPDTLSGGERQRAALARTMLTRPKLLLLDEPLSAVDRKRKAEIMPYLENLSVRFGAPAIYVSHNVDEVLRIADQTVVLKDGRVDAVGETAAMMNAYGVDESDDGSHSGAVLTGVIREHDPQFRLTRIELSAGLISLPINEQKAIGEQVNIRIDARYVAIATAPPEGISIRNVLGATVSSLSRDGATPFVDVELRAGEDILHAQITHAACEDLSLTPGQAVFALIKTASFAI